MPTSLVTGGGGFIGSHLARSLLAQGHRVRILDNFSTGKPSNIADIQDRIELIEGSIADATICKRACEGVDFVFHKAAAPSVPKSVEDPETAHRSNAEGTFNMLVAARDAKVRRFVFAGSSAAYGELPGLPKSESMGTSPLSPYAVHKIMGEHYCAVFANCYGLETISLRYFNVFGPDKIPKSQYAAAIPAFITAIINDQAPTIYGDGEQTRDFTYIENVIEANMKAIAAHKTNGEIVNIACGRKISVNEIIAEINAALGKNVACNYVGERAGDIKHSWADIERAKAVIGFEPVVDLAEGLKRTIAWYQENPS